MTLYVDISPIAVNRTAMYHIVRDTCRNLPNAEFICLGSGLNREKLISNDFKLSGVIENQLKRKFFSGLNKHSQLSNDARLSDKDQLLLFDPLYALSYSIEDLRRATIFVLDLTPVTVPGWHAPVAQAYAEAFKVILRSRARLVAISESTRRDLRVNYGIPTADVDVVPLYSRFSETSGEASQGKSSKSEKPYFLFVGSLEHRKNVIATIEAFTKSGLIESGYQLVLAGNSGAPAGQEALRIAQSTPSVAILGSVSDERLRDLYLGAAGFVLVSKWEGFGLPILEALALRLPVLTSESGAAPEVAGSNAIYADPCSLTSMIQGFQELARQAKNIQESLLDPGSAASKERGNILSNFTFRHYMDTLTRALAASAEAVPNNHSVQVTDTSSHKQPKPFATLDLVAPQPRAGLASLLVKKVLHYLRVIECEEGNTPNDSYSREYLYFVQQTVRRRASRAWREIASPFVIIMPWRIPLAIVWTIWLAFVTSGVRALLLEKDLLEKSSS
jgi:glycosyltransferase involved in cell wall biosynthesis